MDFVCERLGDDHDLEPFDSGVPELDGWLRDSGRDSDGRNLTRAWVWHSGDRRAVGYYTLAPYFIERRVLSRRQGRGLPDRIPCYLLARLALHPVPARPRPRCTHVGQRPLADGGRSQ